MIDLDAVSELIREVATVEVLERFRSLGSDDIEEKSPGDLVTIADRECERVLAERLPSIVDAPVVGEEATEADPGLPAAIESAAHAWIVDPVDGTANFAAGRDDFAVMVALASAGETVAAWIWRPVTDELVAAERGAGAWRAGERLRVPSIAETTGGILKHKYVPEPTRAAFRAVADDLDLLPDKRCAGVEYLDLVAGSSSFLTYWRTKPWDHAPGALIASEAGLRTGRFDGSDYRPGDRRTGLLTCRADRWDDLAPRLLAASLV